jgi:putative membrane protein
MLASVGVGRHRRAVTVAADDRRSLGIIGVVSLAAFGFLVWLIYFNEVEGSRSASVAFLPAVNASLNGLSTVFLVVGFAMIRARRVVAHRRAMMAAFASSSLFLVSYIIYHSLHGDTPFQGQGLIRPVYFAVLISHIVLSAVALPLVFTSFYFSLGGKFAQHKRVSRWTFPLWLYVSVTGVLVFAMLKTFNP